MGAFLAYSILSGLLMLSLYLGYKLFISRENQHVFNRFVLLSIYLISFGAYPLYNLFDYFSDRLRVPTVLNAIEFEVMTVSPEVKPLWSTIIIWIFLFGMVMVLLGTLFTWVRIIRTIHAGKKIKKEGYTLVVTENDRMAPFSWIRYVIIDKKDLTGDTSAIITHELKHISSWHWIDLLLAQSVCIVNWFNPVAWLMRDELMLVHEYQADLAVLENGHDSREYQRLLIKKAVGARFPSLANSINHSKLKKRITMMYKSKSGAGRKMKALALVPMVALALGVASVPAVKATVSTIGRSSVSLDKDNENMAQTPLFNVASLINNGVETTLVVKGEGLGNSVSVSGVTFTNKGTSYSAKSLNTNMTDGKVSITAVFPFSDNYENASVTLAINGEDVRLDLDDSPAIKVTKVETRKKSGRTVIVNSTPDTGNVEIYLDGKEITEAEMNALDPETIASITVDRQHNKIIITTKERADGNASPETKGNITISSSGEYTVMTVKSDSNVE